MFCYEKLINFQLECANENSCPFPVSVGSAASYRSIAYYRYFRLLPVPPHFALRYAFRSKEKEKGKKRKKERKTSKLHVNYIRGVNHRGDLITWVTLGAALPVTG